MDQHGTCSLLPRPFSAGYLQVAAELDALCPGHLRATFQGSDLERQARFLVYAEILAGDEGALANRFAAVAALPVVEKAGADRAVIGRALAVLRPREIVEAVFGAVPEGFQGLLARLGPDPLPDLTLYKAAFALYADPQHRRRAALLRQSAGKVSPAKITAAARLPEVLLRKPVLDKIHDPPVQLASLTAFVDYIRVVCGADDQAIAHSLDSLKPGTSGQDLKVWAKTWVKRQVRLSAPPPIPPTDPAFRLLLGEDLVRTGREFRNCLGDRLTEAFLASSVYYLWEGTPGGAIIALHPLSNGGWFVADAKLARNRKLPASAMRSLQVALGKYDIAIHLLSPESSPSPCPLHYILDSWPYGLSFDEEDDGSDQEDDEPDHAVRRYLDRFLSGINGEPVPDGYYDETDTA